MTITIRRADPTVAFAAAELAKYLGRICPDGRAEIAVGLFEDFGDGPPLPRDPALDDAVRVDVRGGVGTVAGRNPRSVLLAVYRFLWELGCRWPLPGPDGHVLPPPRDAREVTVRLDERAGYRHRTICIEGATSLTNVLDTIDWLPKVGFGGFYMQFREGYVFFDRWYSHDEDPRRKRTPPIDRAMAAEFTALVEREVARRGLQYHAVGHGWQCEAFGVPGIGWMPMYHLTPEFRAKLATFNGERPVPWDVPMLAALCYSDPEVRAAMTRAVADHAGANPRVGYLHVWLDDFTNNKCECDRCRSAGRPADVYVRLLNDIDAELARRGLGTRVVFLAYSDLLWPPVRETLANTDRFVFMYANSRSDYAQPLAPTDAPPVPFRHNRNPPDANAPAQVAALLQQWRPHFAGDGFLFEYYFEGVAGSRSPDRARTIWQDVRNLRAFDLNGIVNCQSLRVYFPTGVEMAVLGRALWDPRVDFESEVRDYYRAAFGSHADACRRFVDAAQAAVVAVRKQLGKDDAAARDQLGRVEQALADAGPVLSAAREAAAQPAQRVSVRLLEVYAMVLRRFTQWAKATLDKNPTAAQMAHFGLRDELIPLEQELQPYFEPAAVIRDHVK